MCLQAMEELLRMGVWDFSMTLSGTDLPIRNVDDLALALAPHRGMCVVTCIISTLYHDNFINKILIIIREYNY